MTLNRRELLLSLGVCTAWITSRGADQSFAQSPSNKASIVLGDVTEDTIRVISAALPDGGFIGIHDSSYLDGKEVKSLIGNSEYLEPGQHEGVTIELNIETDRNPESKTVIGILYKDSNSSQTFDWVLSNGEVDRPYKIDDEPVSDSNYGPVRIPSSTEQDLITNSNNHLNTTSDNNSESGLKTTTDDNSENDEVPAEGGEGVETNKPQSQPGLGVLVTLVGLIIVILRRIKNK